MEIATSCFPELDLPEPPSPADRRRRHTAAIEELRAEHYNAVITRFEPTHSDLWVLRVRPDHGDTSHLPGQYASLGLGYWEDRIDDAEDPAIDDKWTKLIRRSYSISNRIFDDHGYLADETGGAELEFYIVLVPPTDDNIPALTPRLALKRPGDKIYLGPKVAGRYTLSSVVDPHDTVVFLSTGTGEAPHNAMVVELLRKGHSGPIVSAVSVRQWADLGYRHKHEALEERYPNYHYLPQPTREADVPKRYIQDLIVDDVFTDRFDVSLDPNTTHVFLCGNPAMIGLPEESDDELNVPGDGRRGSAPHRARLHPRPSQAARQHPLRGVLVGGVTPRPECGLASRRLATVGVTRSESQRSDSDRAATSLTEGILHSRAHQILVRLAASGSAEPPLTSPRPTPLVEDWGQLVGRSMPHMWGPSGGTSHSVRTSKPWRR